MKNSEGSIDYVLKVILIGNQSVGKVKVLLDL